MAELDEIDHGFHETQSELEQLAGFKTVRDYIVAAVDAEVDTKVSDHHQHNEAHHHDNVPDNEHSHDHSNEHGHSHNAPVAVEKLNNELQSWISTGQDYYRNMRGIKELDNTVAFLRGEYIPVTTGGASLAPCSPLPAI